MKWLNLGFLLCLVSLSYFFLSPVEKYISPGSYLPPVSREISSALTFQHVKQNTLGESILLQVLATENDQAVATYQNVALSDATSSEVIKINGDNFYQMLNMIYYGSEKEKMLGKRLKLSGMFFKDADSFYSNQAYVGRYVIFCCASDTSIAGFFIEGQFPKYKKEQWVSASGTVQMRTTPQGKLPVVVLDKIDNASEEDPYIYPMMDGGGKSTKAGKQAPPI
jgi:uncharacterized membrane protein YcgQ (UPF0703/DUF1980 family)